MVTFLPRAAFMDINSSRNPHPSSMGILMSKNIKSGRTPLCLIACSRKSMASCPFPKILTFSTNLVSSMVLLVRNVKISSSSTRRRFFIGITSLFFEFYKKGTSLPRLAFNPNLTAPCFYLGLGNKQAESFCIGMPVKYLSDLKQVVLVLHGVNAQSVILYRQ